MHLEEGHSIVRLEFCRCLEWLALCAVCAAWGGADHGGHGGWSLVLHLGAGQGFPSPGSQAGLLVLQALTSLENLHNQIRRKTIYHFWILYLDEVSLKWIATYNKNIDKYWCCLRAAAYMTGYAPPPFRLQGLKACWFCKLWSRCPLLSIIISWAWLLLSFMLVTHGVWLLVEQFCCMAIWLCG